MTTDITLAIIIGSTRNGRFGPIPAAWIAEHAAAHGNFAVDLIDLADYDVPLSLPAESPKASGVDYPRPTSMLALTEKLSAADAFIIVTPEYNHSYPASLKAAIDWHFTQWQAKPIAFVSYGSTAGGRHAVLHLENVFTELNAVTVRDGLAFTNYWLAFDEQGQPLDPAAEIAAKAMLDKLLWWADTLRAGRAASTFPE